MELIAPPLERVVDELSRLPGIGRKTAQRLAFHLLRSPTEEVSGLARALVELKEKIRPCRDCFNFADEETCAVCRDTRRDRGLLCVVEEASDVLALERTGSYRGLYHVLGGALSPLRDVGPEQLRVGELQSRVRGGDLREIILATNPNVEGEATAVYLARLLKDSGVHVSRLARGLPAGGDLEYTDELTLQRALEDRRNF